jgi:nitrogen regulatory protein P-II 1
MKKIEALIEPFKLQEVHDALGRIGIEEMTLCEVKGYGRKNRHTEIYRSSEYTMDFLPKIRIDLVVADPSAEPAVKAIIQSAGTGQTGDPEIFISDIQAARSGILGKAAIAV